MSISSIYYVDLSIDITGFTGDNPSEPMGYYDFEIALGDSSYINSLFKLKGIREVIGIINFDNFDTLDQWVPGEPWRIKADEIQINKDKNIIGGILFANTGSEGTLIYDDGVNFYSSYIICNNFRSVGSLSSLTRCFLYGCTVQVVLELYFPEAYSQVISFNSILNIGSIGIEFNTSEEIIFRNSIINLNPSEFLTAMRERSDNNTNQFGWVAPQLFPVWNTCKESNFNFTNIYIEANGGPYTDYDYGLFGSVRIGLGATGIVTSKEKINDIFVEYIDFSVSTKTGSSPLSVSFTPIINSKLSVRKIIWNFGDGVKSSEFKPTHSYQHGGNFTPGLEVIFEDDSHYKKFKINLISVYKVKIVSSENSGIVPFVVKFSTEASLPFGASVVSYDWDFGDGTPHSAEESPVHLYTVTKRYPVSLKNYFSQS